MTLPPVRQLDWSKDPDNWLTDWAIQILVGETEQATYYVHKVTLVSEPNCSNYFVGRFGSEDYKESETNTSTIKLKNDAAAKAFPILLDIVYGKKVTLDDLLPEKSEKTVALYYLLDYFQVDSQFASPIEHFWEESMEGEDCGKWFGQWFVCAKQFGNDKLIPLVVQKCAEKIDDVKLDSLIIQVSNAKFWLDVYASERHPGLARLVAEFCILHKDQLDAETFDKLAEDFLLGFA